MHAVLVDAGPLVALLDRSDPDHQACRSALTAVRDPLATVWPAVTEAMYLLGRVSWPAQDALWELLEEVKILPLEPRDTRRMRALMEKYRSLPMDLADAALVAVAEREMIRSIFTLDGRDSASIATRIGRFSVIP